MAEAGLKHPELVVKIGGSLLGDLPRLRAVLGLLAGASVPLVAVPGGGRFADGVREAQSGIGFSEACAHELAILAMRQTAGLFADLQPGLVPVDCMSDASAVISDGFVPLLVPLAELKEDAAFPKTWEATSDAIAAWVCVRLNMRRIVFVKSRCAHAGCGLEELADAGIVDPVSPGMLAATGIEAMVVGPGEDEVLARLIGQRA